MYSKKLKKNIQNIQSWAVQYRTATVKRHTCEPTCTHKHVHTLPKPFCCSLKRVSLPQVLRGSVVICLILPHVCMSCVCVCVCLPPRPPVALRMCSDELAGGLRCTVHSLRLGCIVSAKHIKNKGHLWRGVTYYCVYGSAGCVPSPMVPCPNL